jgi:hypothetical protein
MKNRVLMKRFNVLGFPSIYLLKDGSTWQYSGVRSVPEVREWVTAACRCVGCNSFGISAVIEA